MIEVRNISKSHKGVSVLSEINLSVPEGTNLGLIGPGGAGKSLLLKIITGLVEPDEGEVVIDDQSVHELSKVELADLHAKIGMLFQNYALFDSLTVYENIAFPLERAGNWSPQQIDDRVNQLLSVIDLPEIGHQYPRELSGGMKKRVSFARAVAQKPPLIFYDDPGAGLDPVTGSKIFDLLRKIKQKHGATSITVSHDLSGMVDICEEFVMLYDGEIVFSGSESDFEEASADVVEKFWRGGTSDPLEEGRITLE